MFSGIFRQSPKPSEGFQSAQDTSAGHGDASASNDDLSDNNTKEKGMFSGLFRRSPKPAERSAPVEERSEESQMTETADFPAETSAAEEEEDDILLDWWRTVDGWDEWNDSSNFQDDEEDTAVEQAADRVYMAAQLFVRLAQLREASLRQRIGELEAMADAADSFHKRTVAASVGGGVASVIGSVTTITGLVLAPFTFGASIIVTAVGIGVATAGSLTSASAKITDSVHSNMDRKKVEKLIQGYQDEIKDIRECLEFVQEGMNVLEKWNFEKYTESLSKQAANQNVKHVMKEGGRAGKALMINTEKLISTVQVFTVAGGAARAAQAISVTTGVMSALFLALDVFFLAKDSQELHKGAKTAFAAKIREVCRELEDGLQELQKVKAELEKTMDGVEVAVAEEGGAGEEDEVLEEELDQLEKKLDRRAQEKAERDKCGQSEEKERHEWELLQKNKGGSFEDLAKGGDGQ